ncbi:frataxin homolog, mitochondrial [Aphidius gifuensis]|uniref:frataxin homolog, mitochondrial n=1 Tax=Aphidius gifuensis TaxID=684658 RepID=UPI001CDC9BA6|nr:frataxin homolog, mitochondrial [Aphidius gifuensis]
MTVNTVEFIKIADKTLDLLTEYFDELVEAAVHLDEADVSCQDGVLTVKLGTNYGTYVVNRQTPNKQIWLSSPTSGPKRYDFINGMWIYKHDGKSLLQLNERSHGQGSYSFMDTKRLNMLMVPKKTCQQHPVSVD